MKKLILLVALLSGISVVAMDHMKERPVLQEASQNKEEARVKIYLTDAQSSEATHEVEIPVHLAKLIGALNELVEDPELKGSVFPLPNVNLVQWRFIEPQLVRVYRISQDASQAAQLRQKIITEFRTLDIESLIGVICASDYLEIPLLLETASEVLKQSALDKISWEELEELPRDIRNQIIMGKVLMLLGPGFGRELAVCRNHEKWITSVCVTQDGKIVSGSRDSTVRLYDIQGNWLAICRGHESEVNTVGVTQDGKIVSGSSDRTVRVWDMEGNQLAVCSGHEDRVSSVCLTSDGKMIVSGSWDGTVRVWDIEGNQLAVCRGHEDRVSSVCLTSDGKIVSGSNYGLRVWDMDGNQLAVCRGHEDYVTSVCLTSDGKMIVSGSYDNTVRVWDMEGNQLAICRGHRDRINSVYVTNDGKIISGSHDGVRVWDMDGNQLAVCRGPEDWVTSVCVTQDGKILSGSADTTVRVWDMQGKELAVCRGHDLAVCSVCVTKDGKIVSGSNDKAVRVWDIGLLGSIMRMDEDRARALWDYMRQLPYDLDKQSCWGEIEKILGEDAPVAAPNTNNNDNE